MSAPHFECIVVGAGPAGVTAAVALARRGVSVLLLEAAIYPGAENWSGAVYFTENLTHPEAFGLEAIEQAPYERRLVKRGAFLARGQTVLGATHHDPKTFS
ncbi:MAG: FAD-dependent oxidoreductase, partial [Planctomycetota bacterium]|nr:FAD-dependent oxidoreductase [Planctomycetota bacterium]